MGDPPDSRQLLLDNARQERWWWQGRKKSPSEPDGPQIASHDVHQQAIAETHPLVAGLQAAQRRIVTLPRRFWEHGLACAAVAHFSFSTSALFIKLTAGRIPVLEVSIFRSAVSFVLSMIAIAGQRIRPVLGHRHNMHLLLMRGISGMSTMATYYASLYMLPLGDAVTLNQLKPPVTALVAWLFLGEPLGWHGLAGCAISLCGVAFLAHPPFLFGGEGDWSHDRMMGTLFGLLAPFCAAGVGYATRRIGKSEPAVVVALWFHMCTLVFLLPPLLLGWPDPAVLPTTKETGFLLGVAATSFTAQILQTRSYQLTLAAKAAAVGFTQVIYGHLFGFLFFGERPTWLRLIGTLLIVIGVLVVAVKPGKWRHKQRAPLQGGPDLLPSHLQPLLPQDTALPSDQHKGAIAFPAEAAGAKAVHSSTHAAGGYVAPAVLIPAGPPGDGGDVLVHIGSDHGSSSGSAEGVDEPADVAGLSPSSDAASTGATASVGDGSAEHRLNRLGTV